MHERSMSKTIRFLKRERDVDAPPRRRLSNRGAEAEAMAARGAQDAAGKLPHQEAIQKSFGGFSIEGVTARSGANAQEACESLGAHAYARGDQIVFGAPPPLRRVAHEAAHIVQQRAGVAPAGIGAKDSEHEKAADAAADAVVSGQSAAPILAQMTGRDSLAPKAANASSVQMDWIDDAGEWIDDKKEGAKEAMSDASDWAGEKVDDAKEAAGDAVDWAEEKLEGAKETASDAGDWIEEKADDAGKWAEEKLDGAKESASEAGEWLEEKASAQANGSRKGHAERDRCLQAV